MIADDLPAYLRKAVDQQLAPDERLVRLEQPDPAHFRRGLAWGTVAIGLLFILFTAITFREGTWSFAILYAIFAGMFLSGPLLLRHIARNTAYAITNERVLIVRRTVRGRLDALAIDGDMLRPRVLSNAFRLASDIVLIDDYRSGDSTRDDQLRLCGLSEVRATEAALNHLIQSSSKSSL